MTDHRNIAVEHLLETYEPDEITEEMVEEMMRLEQQIEEGLI